MDGREELRGEIRSQEEAAKQIEREIVNSIKKGLPASAAGRGDEEPPTIYRVPKVLRQANERCYQPRLFSIGPYHHGSNELKPMEEVKFQHLQALLARNPKLELKDYVRAIRREMEENAVRECYADKLVLQGKKFVEMMVLDGCFLVEMFIRICQIGIRYELWVPYFVSHDLLLLENQIPFCILNCVFHLVAPRQEETIKDFVRHCFKLIPLMPLNDEADQDETRTIKDFVRHCFKLIPLMPLNDEADQDETRESNYHHLLDWFHHHCLPKRVEGGPVSSATKRCFPAFAEPLRLIISSVKRRLKNLGGSVSSATKRCFLALAELLRLIISSVKRRLKNLEAVCSCLLGCAAEVLGRRRRRAREESRSPRTTMPNLVGIYTIIIEDQRGWKQILEPLSGSFPIKIPEGPHQLIPYSIRSAEELQEAGIQFKKKTKKPGCSFLDIQFHENGVVEIPHFYFSDNLHTTFQNLIAYEQCCPKARTFFTGYASFMDDIVNTSKDIQILRHAGILDHGLGSDEELASLFNQMNRGVFQDLNNIFLCNERKSINEFCRTRWNTYRANLMRSYFYNPWAILSLAAAILLLLLTITQTVFSIYPNV